MGKYRDCQECLLYKEVRLRNEDQVGSGGWEWSCVPAPRAQQVSIARAETSIKGGRKSLENEGGGDEFSCILIPE